MRRPGLTIVTSIALAGCGGGGGSDEGSGTTEASTSPTTAQTEPPTSSSTTSDTSTTTMDPDTGGSESESGATTGVGKCHAPQVSGMPDFALEMVADGFTQPTLAVGDPVDHEVVYVLEKGGQIKRVEPGVAKAPAQNWLEIDVTTVIESGLLGLAFAPNYEQDPKIYVAYTPSSSGALVVTEFAVNDGVPDTATARDVIGVGQPQGNHNGGMVLFGPDDLLYLSVGDGGVQNDGCDHGQDGDKFLGTILRIDPAPDGTQDISTECAETCPCDVPGPYDYTIPADNPFVGDANVRDEVWAYGLRNPWRMSFDPVDGLLWVGDVGQGDWEEVDVLEAGDNAGWGDMEGLHCFNDDACEVTEPGSLNGDGLRMPVAEYENDGVRCSVIGLGVYRSCEVPDWQGIYFYGDYCSSEIWAVRYDGTTVEDLGVVAQADDAIFGGGYDARGNVYVTTAPLIGPGTRPVYRIVPL